jgi:hypothetical protein
MIQIIFVIYKSQPLKENPRTVSLIILLHVQIYLFIPLDCCLLCVVRFMERALWPVPILNSFLL